MIIVTGMTSYEYHPVVGRTPANDFGAWPGDTPAVHIRLGFGPISPFEARVLQHEFCPGWHFCLPRPVGRSCLQYQDLQVRIAGQPVGEYTARRSSADYDVVEFLMGTHFCVTSVDPLAGRLLLAASSVYGLTIALSACAITRVNLASEVGVPNSFHLWNRQSPLNWYHGTVSGFSRQVLLPQNIQRWIRLSRGVSKFLFDGGVVM